MKIIELSQGKTTLIDDEDFETISKHKWHYSDPGYAKTARPIDGTRFMHRMILKALKGQFVDHINGDKLDNRRSNLRLCTNSQNMSNRDCPKSNTSGYKGVDCSREGVFIAYITHNYRKLHLGMFPSKEEAARAYDAAAVKLFGPFASLNFGGP